MNNKSPGGIDFKASPPPGVKQPAVGRVIQFDWPETAGEVATTTTPRAFSGFSLFDASGAFASRPRGYTEALATRKRTLDDTPADQRVRPPPSPERRAAAVTPDTPTRKRPATPLWGGDAGERPASVHKDLLKALWPDA